jgi:hypothetical protein
LDFINYSKYLEVFEVIKKEIIDYAFVDYAALALLQNLQPLHMHHICALF